MLSTEDVVGRSEQRLTNDAHPPSTNLLLPLTLPQQSYPLQHHNNNNNNSHPSATVVRNEQQAIPPSPTPSSSSSASMMNDNEQGQNRHTSHIAMLPATDHRSLYQRTGSARNSSLQLSSLSSPLNSTSRVPPSPSSSEPLPDYLFYDANTFQQVKRLYSGMLIVAITYAAMMVIMMAILFKTLPPEHSHSAVARNQSTLNFDPTSPFITSPSASGPSSTSHFATSTLTTSQHNTRTVRSHLDQIVAINFLTLVLYGFALFAAQRELYTLTLAFTSTLSFTMMFSIVKIFVEGVQFPNNFMSLLLRISIVFVALVYMGQLRRKQSLIRSVWLGTSPNSTHLSSSHTAQLIRQYLASQSMAYQNGNGSNHRSSSNNNNNNQVYKSDADIDDLPPNYEDALHCPAPETLLQKSPKVSRPTGTEPVMCRGQSESLPSFDQVILEHPDNHIVMIALDSNNSDSQLSDLQPARTIQRKPSNVALTIENNSKQ